MAGEEPDTWKNIEIPKYLEGRFYDIGDYLSRDDELMEAVLKVLIFQTRLLQGRDIQAPIRRIDQIANIPIEAKSFEEVNTDEAVTVNPGEREAILEWNPVTPAIVWEVGTSDEDYTDYKWIVDGEKIFEEDLRQPLGLYNSPYRFPNPLLMEREFIVEVSRDDDAGASADYVSKIRAVPIPTSLYNRLKDVLEV